MLNLVYGRSKSGKTTFVYNKIYELIKTGEEKVLLIVPDQTTFDTEKAILKLLGPSLAQNVLVLGFSRMCDYVFEFTGTIRKAPADDCTKALLMSIALEEVKDNLTLYSDKALNPELAKLMLDARKELALSGNDLSSVSGKAKDVGVVTGNKLNDILLASSAMDALISESFDDPDAELSIVADIIDKRKVFDDYVVFIDSYLVFNAPELKAISVLMSQCREIYITLSYDGVSKKGVFSTSADTASALKRLADSAGVKVADPILCNYSDFYKTEALSFLEQNIFMDDKAVFDEKADSITLYVAKDRYNEIDYVSRQIRKLIIDHGYRYNQIAVVGRDLSVYSSIIDTAFNKYGISYFADKPHDISSKPLVKLISSCFMCVLGGFDKDDVLSLLKTGLTSNDTDDIFVFENYIYTWQINYSSLMSEFTANPRGFADQLTFDDVKNLGVAEKVRESVITPLVKFKKSYAESTAGEIAKGLYDLLIELGTDKKLLSLSETLEKWDEVSSSAEQLRLWEVFCQTLDRTVNVIGERKLTLKRFFDLFMLQLGLTDISFIPKAVDQVIVGDIHRVRLGGRRCVFVVGAVDGEFPKVNTSSGLFTPGERSELSELSILDESDDERNAEKELYLCYYALTGASEKLFLSYPSAELNGDINSPSVMINELMAVVPECTYSTIALEDAQALVWAAEPSYELYARRARSSDALTSSLRNYFSENPEYKHKLNSLENTLDNKRKFLISDRKISQKLFGTDMHLSASKIERYHMCRFSYFCQYGLKASERRKASIDALEYGSFVHYILENFFKSYTKSDYSFLSENDIERKTSEISEEYADLHFGGLTGKSARFVYLFNSVKESASFLVQHLLEELSQSNFTPVDYELDIGKDISAYRLQLQDNVSVTVTGKVDRVDKLVIDNQPYIRIVDYKTGTKVFNLSDVMYGLNLQMLLYLSVIKSKGNGRYGDNIMPAGVLYMPAFVPTLEMAATATSDDLITERNKKLRMNGILLDDELVLTSMDKELKGMYIPVSMGARGVKGADNLATLEEFGAIFSHIDKLISEMAHELLSGNIHADPTMSSTNACDWCPYSSVCIGKTDDNFRYITKLDIKQILKELGLKPDEEVEE